MLNYKNLLVVIEPEHQEQPALSRALEIASKTGADVTAIMVVYDFSYDMTTMLSADEREAMRSAVIKDRQGWLKAMLESLTSCSINVVVEWHNRAYEAIIDYAVEHASDIVIKATKRHDDLASVIFTPTDWHLLRKCPTPVLLVKQHDWPVDGNIIAAVNVGSDDDAHIRLNTKVTELAKDYASLLSGHVHLVNAYPSTPLNIAIEIPEFDPERYHQSVRLHHEEAMAEHANSHNIEAQNTHVLAGLPEHVVPQVATHLDAELVIIGTVGRVGLSAALIGNTAEHVIDELECDVLAIKPSAD